MTTLDQVKAAVGALPGTDLPIAFLPVQIQTRFVDRDDFPQLLIRVYPDDLHLDSHPKALTAAEVQWGRRYWELIWPIANNNQDALRAAWQSLATRFGARRAAWVRRVLTPANLDQRPASPPAFPDPGPLREETTFQRVHARLLPDRWVVFGYRHGNRVLTAFGSPIPQSLAVTPDPADTPDPDPGADDRLPIDGDTRWLIDFDAAEVAGMGIRVIRPPTVLDTLLVFGVRASQDGTDELEAVLDGHHYSSGMAFIPPGTPTNNTAEESAGFRKTEPEPEDSFATEVAGPSKLHPDADGATAARLIGLREDLFAAVAGATLTEDRISAHLQLALWPVTGGYYLRHILGGPPGELGDFGFDTLDAARLFFIDFVRHQGPLPTLRIGHQPYGLLPAMALDPLPSGLDNAGRFNRALKALREVWRQALPKVPRLSAGAQDDENLVEILRMQPVSVGYRTRLAFEHRFFTANGLMAGGLPPELAQHNLLLRDRITELWALHDGTPSRRVLEAIPSEAARRIQQALVQPGGEVPGAHLDPDYLTFLAKATFDDVLSENVPGGTPNALLYQLLRHSVLLEQTTTVARILARRDPGNPPPIEETLVDVLGGLDPSRTRTLLRVMEEDHDLRARVHELRSADEPEAVVLDQLRNSLSLLPRVQAGSLARHFSGCLDLFSYRLDAWITALATKRLRGLRRLRPRGLVIGGFGWVEQLHPTPRTLVTEPIPCEDGEGPLYEATEPGGYIHAPSMSHASAAAVLRSGHLADTGDSGTRPFAVDLRSGRVRLAKWLLEGVRQGQPLGDQLGYRLERGLHEAGLDRFIPGVRSMSRLADLLRPIDRDELHRRMAVLAQRYGWPESTQLTAMHRLTKAMVTDGLELARLRLANDVPFDRGLPDITSAERFDLEEQLDALADAVDALSDALTAEGVYQAVRGNTARAAASVDAVAHGDIPPPELQVAQTPRPGVAQTHRLIVLLHPPVTVPNPSVRQVRTAAEPSINSWLAQLLGPLSAVRFRAEFVVGDDVVPGGGELRLDRLGMSHLDLMYLPAGDLDRLLEFDLRQVAPGTVPPEAPLRLLGKRPADMAANLLSLDEFRELLRVFRDTILAARAIDGHDLAPADDQPGSSVDPGELRTRADRVSQALTLARQRLADAQGALALQERLIDFVFLGIPQAIPDQESLPAQAEAAIAEAQRRLAQEAALQAGFDQANATPEEQVLHGQERLRALLGPEFVALPQLHPVNANALAATLQRSQALQGGDPLQAFSWLQTTSRVRPGASRLTRALTCAAAIDRPAALDLRVGQLPFTEGDRWIALPADGYPAGKLALVAHVPQPFKADAAVAGLLIDEWVDVVPAAEVTTGIAVHTESPGARPPQSVLLGVAPLSATGWTVELIEKTLLETLELARLRTVDPQTLTEDVLIHRALPATYLSVNLARDTLSTDFMPRSG